MVVLYDVLGRVVTFGSTRSPGNIVPRFEKFCNLGTLFPGSLGLSPGNKEMLPGSGYFLAAWTWEHFAIDFLVFLDKMLTNRFF